jgi:hypothetical protein
VFELLSEVWRLAQGLAAAPPASPRRLSARSVFAVSAALDSVPTLVGQPTEGTAQAVGAVPGGAGLIEAAPLLRVLGGGGGGGGPGVQRGTAVPSGLARSLGVAGRASAPEVVPVPEALAGLFPWRGMRLGSVVSVQGSTSLLFALLSTASAAGAWTAIVGRDDLGLLAAEEAGVQVQRLALVPHPGAELVAVAGALLDGMQVVALAGVEQLTPAQVRRLAGRARQRHAVLLPLGDWHGADVRLSCERIEWSGLGDGHGRLRSVRMAVRALGRGASARPRTAVIETGDPRTATRLESPTSGELPAGWPAASAGWSEPSRLAGAVG